VEVTTMVKLTDAHAEALALVGTGTLTSAQVKSVLDVFSGGGEGISIWRTYRAGTLERVSSNYRVWIDDRNVSLSTSIGLCATSINAVTNAFLWGDVTDVFDIKLEVGHDEYDYTLAFTSKDTAIWGAFNFRLSRTPYEVID